MRAKSGLVQPTKSLGASELFFSPATKAKDLSPSRWPEPAAWPSRRLQRTSAKPPANSSTVTTNMPRARRRGKLAKSGVWGKRAGEASLAMIAFLRTIVSHRVPRAWTEVLAQGCDRHYHLVF